MKALFYHIIFFFCTFFLISLNSHAESRFKELEIRGLKIHPEEYLITKLGLGQLSKNIKHFKPVARKLNDFYRAGGYVLAETFLIEETGGKLTVFIDEGRLGSIIFTNLNTVQTLRMKYEYRLKKRIYNKYVSEKEIKRLKKKFGFSEITESIKREKKYDKALIQLNEDFSILGLRKASLPLFENAAYRYSLELNFVRDSESEKNKRILNLDIDTSYSRGFIPQIEYLYPSLIQKEDLLVLGASAGIQYGYYGLNLDFKKSPDWTFMEAHSDYNFTPTRKKYFTPQIRLSINNSRASRNDLGLEEYKFLVIKGVLAPGFTILKKMKIYFGCGGERVYVLDPEIDPDVENPVQIEEHVVNYSLLELRLIYELSWLPPMKKEKRIELAYRYYINEKTFHEFSAGGDTDFELPYFSIYSFASDYEKVWIRPPFYHEVPVSSSIFKGLMGNDYYTRHMARTSHELKTSLYRALLYGGIFTDLAWFKGSGYDLSGNQYAYVSGISGHVILLDQFQFDIYWGRDSLYPSGESQYNIYMRLFKKW